MPAMRIVVTGGAGFIGSHLADGLIARGDEVLVVDDLSTGIREQVNPGAKFLQQDIRESNTTALLVDWRPDAICHLAAQMSVSRSVRDPLLDAGINLIGGLNVLEAAREADARLLFSSTGGALYGDADVMPTPESEPAWPVSPYGVAKLSFEHYLHCYRVAHGLSYAALRFANVYGPRQNPHGEAGVVAIFCLRMLAGEPAVINGDGTFTRDYIYVDDVVNAAFAALGSEEVGHFNVGTGRESTVNQVFHLLAGRLGVDLEEVHGPVRPGDQRTSALDSALIEQTLAWRPQVSLEEGIARTADWFSARAQT
jgi:UDP-glucose 4-epimerase